jgi:hypothetical protein
MNDALQMAFIIIERLAAVVATPGIDEEVKKSANQTINRLINEVVSKSVLETRVKSAGIIT